VSEAGGLTQLSRGPNESACRVFLVGNLVCFPFFVCVTVSVTVGVSGFEGGEVVVEVIWQCNI
jgi:hypothetical protein